MKRIVALLLLLCIAVLVACAPSGGGERSTTEECSSVSDPTSDRVTVGETSDEPPSAPSDPSDSVTDETDRRPETVADEPKVTLPKDLF